MYDASIGSHDGNQFHCVFITLVIWNTAPYLVMGGIYELDLHHLYEHHSSGCMAKSHGYTEGFKCIIIVTLTKHVIECRIVLVKKLYFKIE